MAKSPMVDDYAKKIGGYDGYDVREAVSTMRKADEIKSDPKFLAVVVKQMNKEADELDESASLLKKVSKKLKSIRKGSK